MRRVGNPTGGGEAGDVPRPLAMAPALTHQLLLLGFARQELELLVESARFAGPRADIARLNERLDRLEQRLEQRLGAKR